MMGQIMASYYVHFVYKVNIMVIHKKECQGCFFQKEVHIVFFDTKRKNILWFGLFQSHTIIFIKKSHKNCIVIKNKFLLDYFP